MTPHQGAGAGQAFEVTSSTYHTSVAIPDHLDQDGYILASLLAHPSITRATLSRALQAYDAVRRPFTQGALQRSRTQGLLYQLNAPGWEDLTAEDSTAGRFPREKLDDIGRAIEASMKWQADGAEIGEERDKAIRLLESDCAISD